MILKQPYHSELNKASMLMLSNVCPFPPQSGDRIRVMELLKRFSGRFKVTFISLYDGSENCDMVSEELIRLSKCERVILIPFKKTTLKAMLSSLILLKTFREQLFFSKKLRGEVKKELSLNNYSIVYQNVLATYPQISEIPLKIPLLTVLDQQNIYRNWWLNVMTTDQNIINRSVAFLEWIKEEKLERKTLPKFDVNVCVSKEEVHSTIQYGVDPSQIILGPNGANCEVKHPSIGSSHEIVFCGSLDVKMNEDAVVYFVSLIWPLIKKNYDAKLIIIGRNPSPKIRALNGINDIFITGTVPDVKVYLQKAGVIVAPFRQGAGTKLKVLEALALGKTMVSTSIGCQGIDVTHDHDILIANNPESFALYVEKALSDRYLRERIGLNAIKLIEEKYNWDNICENIINLLYEKIK